MTEDVIKQLELEQHAAAAAAGRPVLHSGEGTQLIEGAVVTIQGTAFETPPARIEDLLRSEIATLRRQNAALQGRCSELLAEKRGIRFLVEAFHHKFGYAARMTPTIPDADEIRFRLALIAEEFFELLAAVVYDDDLGEAARSVRDRIRNATICVDLAEFADAMADLDYVVEGTRLTFGIDGWPILLEVQRANMDKTNEALQAADDAKTAGVTKAQKPSGWRPPDIEGELRKQGWRP